MIFISPQKKGSTRLKVNVIRVAFSGALYLFPSESNEQRDDMKMSSSSAIKQIAKLLTYGIFVY